MSFSLPIPERKFTEQVEAWHACLSHSSLHLNMWKTEYVKTCLSLGTVQCHNWAAGEKPVFPLPGITPAVWWQPWQWSGAWVIAAWIRWQDVTETLCNKQIPTYLKSKIYQMMVCPVAPYGTECWPLIKSLETHLTIMEMSMLRQSAGFSCLERITNVEVWRCMRVEPITEKLKEWCLQWYGQMVHADPDTLTNVAYTLQVAVKHRQGWLKQRWMDCLKAAIEYPEQCQQMQKTVWNGENWFKVQDIPLNGKMPRWRRNLPYPLSEGNNHLSSYILF